MKRTPSLALLELMKLDNITTKIPTFILFICWNKSKKLHDLLHFLLPQIGRVMLMEYISLLMVKYLIAFVSDSLDWDFTILCSEELRRSKKSRERLPKWVEYTFC